MIRPTKTMYESLLHYTQFDNNTDLPANTEVNLVDEVNAPQYLPKLQPHKDFFQNDTY